MAVPAVPPVIFPLASTLAVLLLLLLHAPPVTASVNAVLLPAHTLAVPASGNGVRFTVTMALAAQPVAVTTKEMVAVPAAPPVTVPVPVTVAIPVALLLQVPPVVPSASAIVFPAHMAMPPLMASGAGFTLSIFVTVQPLPSE